MTDYLAGIRDLLSGPREPILPEVGFDRRYRFGGRARDLRDDHAAALAVSRDTYRRIEAEYDALGQVGLDRSDYLQKCEANNRRPENLERFQEREARHKKEIARLEAIHAPQLERAQLTGALVQSTQHLLHFARGEVVSAQIPKLVSEMGKLNDPQGVVKSIRDERERLLVQIEELERAPYPAEILVERATASVRRLAEQGAPSLNARPHADPRVWDGDPFNLTQLVNSGSGIGFGKLALWASQDAIIARLTEMIGDDLPGALSDTERAEQLKKLRSDLVTIERREEAAIFAAEQQFGLLIPRRADADPKILLWIDLIDTAEKAPAPAPTPPPETETPRDKILADFWRKSAGSAGAPQ